MAYANPQIEAIFERLTAGIDKTIEYMKGEFAVMRAGRANPRVLDRISVDYYGTPTPINQMGNISSPEPRQLLISVWDKSALKLVEKAILSANIGITPINDGNFIRLNFPEVTEERRKEIVKQIKKLGEETKVATRNERRDAFDKLKKVKSDKLISEDLVADYEKEVDEKVNKSIELIDKLVKEKEKDIMSV
ncbi:MAG: ribosome recycling factor [Clostridia bacterium]|nr:ribosome recycling factor [Clostridia bacterium]